ncbi:MAG: hypothetical protein P8Y58_16075, partial [Novosphingobium sp.]
MSLALIANALQLVRRNSYIRQFMATRWTPRSLPDGVRLRVRSEPGPPGHMTRQAWSAQESFHLEVAR